MAKDEEVIMVVRVPLSRIESEVRQRYTVSIPLASATMQDGFLVFRFGSSSPRGDSAHEVKTEPAEHLAWVGDSSSLDRLPPRPVRMRRQARRNRMRTRGWGIVAKIVNSKGQTATIYEPFVEALRGKDLSHGGQEAAVAKILKQNGNRPGKVSIDYYLSNTLEYLTKEGRR